MSIGLVGISKRYGTLPVVRDVDLEIAQGELFVLLGPSGSGKSTLLRIIAGLAEPDAGRVLIGGDDVTGTDPRRRGIGFVFQHYALFRHLSVADNVEFPLRVRRVPRAERQARREELLELVGLSGFGLRKPGQLSGGQQQRVALARALAGKPRVLLLDEPFGALDSKIRVELRHAIRGIQRELGVTTVFVTHDQEEAFALGDRVAVLDGGRLLEVGPPEELYLHPRHERVAAFLGAANVLVGEASDDGVRLGNVELKLGVAAEAPRGRRVRIVFRPEDVEVAAGKTTAPMLGTATVEEATFAGSFERLRLRLPTPQGVRGVVPPAPFGAGFVWLDALRPQHEAQRLPLQPGAQASVGVRRVHVVSSAALRLLVLAADASSPASRFSQELVERTGAVALPAGGGRPTAAAGSSADTPGPFDLAVVDLGPGRPHLPPELPGSEVDHLVLLSAPAPLPKRILVCVAVGEPGKEDVGFAERLAWRLQAQVTVLTVLDEDEEEHVPDHVRRFLGAAARALGRRGVEVQTRIRFGPPRREILAEVSEGGYGLLVVGAPLPSHGHGPLLTGLVTRLLAAPCPLLVVRAFRERPLAAPTLLGDGETAAGGAA